MGNSMKSIKATEDLSTMKILIVDDQSFNIDAIVIIMNSLYGMDTEKLCSFAYNGKEALLKVKQSV